MAKGRKEEPTVLYRVAKFEIRPTPDQIELLRKVSSNLWLVRNDAISERMKLYDDFIAPVYERIKQASEENDAPRVAELRKQLVAAYKEHRITFFDQVNALTPRRAHDSAFAAVPRNWQEETLDTVDGGFKSFLALRKNGDPKARPPRLQDEWDFCEITGRYGFKLSQDGRQVTLSSGKLASEPFVFPIPEEYQLGMLIRASAVKKFTLYRDVRDMRQKGRFWLSLAYEIPKPATKPFVPEEAVYIALGASSIGVVSPKGEEVVPLWRADKHWKPKADAVSERMKGSHVIRNSRKWKRRDAARRKMYRTMGAQQKQDRREVVIEMLRYHGVHFVVTDLVVRSKKGKLADASNPERGGPLGLNWAAQNTGSLAYLVEWLQEKSAEYGGTVRKHKLTGELPEGRGEENKIPMARALRDDFLSSVRQAA